MRFGAGIFFYMFEQETKWDGDAIQRSGKVKKVNFHGLHVKKI